MAVTKASPAKKPRKKPRKKKAAAVVFRCRLGHSRGSLTLRYHPIKGS